MHPQRLPKGAGDVITLANRYSSLEEMSWIWVEHHTPAQIKENTNKMATIIQWNYRSLRANYDEVETVELLINEYDSVALCLQALQVSDSCSSIDLAICDPALLLLLHSW